MIDFLRMDDRLLHGQVVVKWINLVQPDAIVVANDEVVKNEISKLALKMAKPEGVKLAIKSIDDAVSLLNNSQTQTMKLFVVVKNAYDARRLVERTKNVNIVNIGGMSNKKEGGKMILSNVYINSEDIEHVKEIIKHVNEVDVRVVPSSPKKDFLSCIKDF